MSSDSQADEILKLLKQGDRQKIVRALARMVREREREAERLERLRSVRRR